MDNDCELQCLYSKFLLFAGLNTGSFDKKNTKEYLDSLKEKLIFLNKEKYEND